MCFTDQDIDYEWYCDSQTTKVERLAESVRCVECRCEIQPGELCEHVHQDGSNEFLDDCDDDYPDVPWHFEWDGYSCGSCALTRWLVHAHELEEGCRESESWCPFGLLWEHCIETDFEWATREDGAKWLEYKLAAKGSAS